MSLRTPTLPLRPPREEDFTSRLHDERLAARLGSWLGICFTVCFVTGLLSHFIKAPPGWFVWPTRPVSLYRVTQGLHVLSGTAAVPLLLAKLYTVYPKLFAWPPISGVLNALERLSLLVLVSSAFFQLITGLMNVAHWYAWGFGFPRVHYAMAWIAIGSIVVHVGVKLPIIRRGLRAPLEGPSADYPIEDEVTDGVSRRTFFRATGLASFAVLLATAGASVPFLRRISGLAVRDGDGPQGLPINVSAFQARVTQTAIAPDWALHVTGPRGTRAFGLAELQAMPQHTYSLPIACVEGWSASAVWTGVRVRDLVAAVGGSREADVRFESLQRGHASRLPALHARDDLSLVALRLHGEVLDLDHGYPARLIAPSRPGELQTKWLAAMKVL